MSRCILHVVFAIMTFVFIGCASESTQPEIPIGQGFSLAIGQSTKIIGENLTIKFVEVIEDSRCPKNATCIWAGRVSAAIQLTDRDPPYRMVLTQPGLTEEDTRENYKNYQLAFSVTPYPEAGKQIAAGDYRLRLTVTKK